MNWTGVIPAMTTPFAEDMSLDTAFLARHATWLVENGCSGVVALGSLGEGATLEFSEKRKVLDVLRSALGDTAPVVAGISALSTKEAVELAKMAEQAGCAGLMVLPPYVYSTDWREMKAHVSAVLLATPLSAMLYNNPVAYKTDFLPAQVAELLGEHENLHAIKESSGDVRRIAALRALCGARLKILCGVDDLILEAVLAGATGWIAGLVNAFPSESVALFDMALRGDRDRAFDLYKWFLPLLRMDTVPKFVQLIKLAQAEVGMGTARVRAPRLRLVGAELEEARRTIAEALAARP
jgi:4-hydroxy-tetrahydrodipicolinate synthase